MQTYQETHPWITFTLDLNRASYQLWMLLGEAQSKCFHISGIPLMPSVTKKLHAIYLAKGAVATTAIEGNTLTEEDALKRIEGKSDLPPSKEYLGQEIDNIVEGCNKIAEELFTTEKRDISIDDIKGYNKLVLKKLPLDEQIVPGELRTYQVSVAKYLGVNPKYCETLLDQLVNWLNNNFNTPSGYTIAFGILKAIIAHIYITWIHPFGDGNGRTARLIEFQIMLSVGVPSPAAHLLSNHYNATRQEYYRQLDQASKSGGNILPFIEYALQGFVDGLKEQIEEIRKQQIDVHWKNFIYDTFKEKEKKSDLRRRRFILDISNINSEIPLAELRHASPRIAEEYAGKTQKTILRDIQILRDMKLLRKTEKGYIANKIIILAFLPK